MVGTILQRLRESKEEQVIKLQLYRLQTEALNPKYTNAFSELRYWRAEPFPPFALGQLS